MLCSITINIIVGAARVSCIVQHPVPGSALGASVPHPTRHPHAPGDKWCGEGQPA